MSPHVAELGTTLVLRLYDLVFGTLSVVSVGGALIGAALYAALCLRAASTGPAGRAR